MNRLVIAKYLFIVGLGLSALSASAQLTFGPGPSAAGQGLDGIAAIVDDDIITRSELDRALAQARRQVASADSPPSDEVLVKRVLETLIVEQIQVRAAERGGIVIDDPTLNAAVETIAKRNNLTLSQLRQAVEGDGISFARFREDVRRELLSTRLRQRIVDSRIEISDQEVEQALEQFQPEPEFKLAQILIPLAADAPPDQLRATVEKVRQVQAQLEQGTDFVQLATAVSASRENGELGWFTMAKIPPMFAEIVPQLKPGEVSKPARSAEGVHFLKLLDTRQSQPSAEKTRQNLLQGKAEEEWELWLRQQREEAYVEIRL